MADWDLPPRLEPLFPIPAFGKDAMCPHKRKIRRGSIFVCMVCHESGLDHLAILKRDSRTDPKPEAAVETKPGAKQTRKQKRAKARAEQSRARV